MQTIRTNTKVKAPTQYTNFDFNSFCLVGGVMVAAGDTGLFQLVGDDDAGESIEAEFTPYTTDFGLDHGKRPRFVDLGLRSSGSVEVEGLGDGVTPYGPITVTAAASETNQRRRKSFNRDKAFAYGTFTFRNIDGAEFLIDTADVHLYHLSHGRS